MDEHPSDVDKHGRPVSRFVQEAVEALREEPSVHKVLVVGYETGRIQVWSNDGMMDGEAIHAGIDAGYTVDFVKERGLNPPPGRDSAAYMELVPSEHR